MKFVQLTLKTYSEKSIENPCVPSSILGRATPKRLKAKNKSKKYNLSCEALAKKDIQPVSVIINFRVGKVGNEL